MDTMPISKFRATCLATLERVRRTGRPLRVTRFGKPVADVVPPAPTSTRRGWLGGLMGYARDPRRHRHAGIIAVRVGGLAVKLLLDTHVWVWEPRRSGPARPATGADAGGPVDGALALADQCVGVPGPRRRTARSRAERDDRRRVGGHGARAGPDGRGRAESRRRPRQPARSHSTTTTLPTDFSPRPRTSTTSSSPRPTGGCSPGEGSARCRTADARLGGRVGVPRTRALPQVFPLRAVAC
jgi:antitoxin (DNA-binding transcriptional repressor) of toxin-antitoxin stability system